MNDKPVYPIAFGKAESTGVSFSFPFRFIQSNPFSSHTHVYERRSFKKSFFVASLFAFKNEFN